MESKKINQLATELAPELSDLTIIGDPTTGISKKITLSQMASLFTGTVEEYASLSAFPLVGAADTIYIALDTNIIYRWNTGTSAYVELSPNIVTSLVFNDANGFDGTISLVGSTATLTITTALTTGSVGFIGASGALLEDNANFFWNNSTKRLGINTNAPTTALDVFGSGIIGRVNGTSTNNAFIGFASAGSNKWSIGNVQSDHRFRIYNEATTSELVSVLQTGQFGIGIANPTTKLHIDGGASALIANLDADVSVAKSISFRSDNSARINLEVSGTESGSNAGANLFIRTYSDAGALLNTPLTITRSTGNVGINTTNPSSKFVVSNAGAEGIELQGTGSVSSGAFLQTYNRSTNQFFDFDIVSNNIIFRTGQSYSESVRISSVGNLGIGTNNPRERFEIAGLSGNIRIYGRSGVADNHITSNTYYNGSAWVRDNSSQGAVAISLIPTGLITFNTTSSTSGYPDERMRINATGSVGIGTVTPSERLDVVGGAVAAGNGTIKTGITYSSLGLIGTFSNHDLGIITNGTEKLRVSASGNFGVGTGSFELYGFGNYAGGSITHKFISTASDSFIGFQFASNNSVLNFATSNALGSPTIITRIISTTTSTSNNSEAGYLSFYTKSGAISTAAEERARITSGGDFLIGTTSGSRLGSAIAMLQVSGSGGGGQINISGGYSPDAALNVRDYDSKLIAFFYGNTKVGSVTTNGSTTSYNTSSDYRLKEDLKDFDGLNILSKIKFYDFAWKTDNSRTTGVIAHELQEIIPYAVNGEKDAIDEDKKPYYQGVDYSKLVAIQGRAIQQLEAKIKQLESK